VFLVTYSSIYDRSYAFYLYIYISRFRSFFCFCKKNRFQDNIFDHHNSFHLLYLDNHVIFFLPSGRGFIFRANTFLLYSALYYCPFSSGCDPSVVFASYFLSRAASILLLLVTNLFLWVAFYYSLVFQLLLAAIIILAVRIYPTSTKRLK
jgi:hypothetical protein